MAEYNTLGGGFGQGTLGGSPIDQLMQKVRQGNPGGGFSGGGNPGGIMYGNGVGMPWGQSSGGATIMPMNPPPQNPFADWMRNEKNLNGGGFSVGPQDPNYDPSRPITIGGGWKNPSPYSNDWSWNLKPYKPEPGDANIMPVPFPGAGSAWQGSIPIDKNEGRITNPGRYNMPQFPKWGGGLFQQMLRRQRSPMQVGGNPSLAQPGMEYLM